MERGSPFSRRLHSDFQFHFRQKSTLQTLQSPKSERWNVLRHKFTKKKKETRTNLAMKFLDVPWQRLGRFVHVVAKAAHQLHRVAGGRERTEAAATAQRVRRWVRQTEQVLDLQFGFNATQVVNPVLEGVESFGEI